jgi:Tfp pilus assembly protein PilV
MDAAKTPFFRAVIIAAVALVACVLGALALFALSTLHGEEAQQSQVLENRAYDDLKAKNYSSAGAGARPGCTAHLLICTNSRADLTKQRSSMSQLWKHIRISFPSIQIKEADSPAPTWNC